MITVSFASTRSSAAKTQSAHAIFIGEDLVSPGKEIIGDSYAYLNQSLQAAQFKGKVGEVLTLLNPNKSPTHLLVVGVGPLKF